MNDDDKELFGIVKDTSSNHIKLMLMKSMRNSDAVDFSQHFFSEIQANKLFPSVVDIKHTQLYEIEGCKEYVLVLATSKTGESAASYIPKIREIISEMVHAYMKNKCSATVDSKVVYVTHRRQRVTSFGKYRDKTLDTLKLLYPSSMAFNKELCKPPKPQSEASRLMDLYAKNKQIASPIGISSTDYVRADPAVAQIPKKWSNVMPTITKLQFLQKAKLTPTTPGKSCKVVHGKEIKWTIETQPAVSYTAWGNVK